MQLKITVLTGPGGRRVLRLVGAMDLQSRDLVLAAALIGPDVRAIALDMSQVSFIDSSGIGAMIELAREAADAGIGLTLRAPSPRVHRILELTGLLHTWPIEPADAESVSNGL